MGELAKEDNLDKYFFSALQSVSGIGLIFALMAIAIYYLGYKTGEKSGDNKQDLIRFLIALAVAVVPNFWWRVTGVPDADDRAVSTLAFSAFCYISGFLCGKAKTIEATLPAVLIAVVMVLSLGIHHSKKQSPAPTSAYKK